MIGLNVTAGVNVIIYLWCFWLARRVTDGKSNGTLYMVLLILGLVGQVASAIMSRSLVAISTFDFLANAMGLYYLYKVKVEK